MDKRIFLLLAIISLVALMVYIPNNLSGTFTFNKNTDSGRPVVVWYTVAKWLDDGFLEKAEKYKPDIVLLSVFAEDDVLPLNGSKTFDLKGLVDKLHSMDIKVYYSYSVFSRSMYEEIKNTSLPFEEYAHVSDYAKYLSKTDEKRYHELFDYYFEHGLDPRDIPKVSRKPVNGFYVEPGHYTMINPLYKPYRDFMISVINETIQIARPDGLAFDHIRFFTFDEGYDEDIRSYILQNFDFDIYNYTPRPMFQLNSVGWGDNDRLYYYARAKLIEFAVSDIVSKFPEYIKFGTTMGMIDPARSNGQYVELQSEVFDGLLLMAYDKSPDEVARNVRETVNNSNVTIILGISILTEKNAIDNIKAGLANGAKGIYLLGYKFDESVHNYLLDIRKED